MKHRAVTADQLLLFYCLWGAVAVAAFLMGIYLLFICLAADGADLWYLAGLLCSGFLWIGTTSLSRHALIRTKEFIGKSVGLPEFLLTQLVFLLFPFHYLSLRREVEAFKRRMTETKER